jgi:hypothetical protein
MLVLSQEESLKLLFGSFKLAGQPLDIGGCHHRQNSFAAVGALGAVDLSLHLPIKVVSSGIYLPY